MTDEPLMIRKQVAYVYLPDPAYEAAESAKWAAEWKAMGPRRRALIRLQLRRDDLARRLTHARRAIRGVECERD